jgi:hypothetical protein
LGRRFFCREQGRTTFCEQKVAKKLYLLRAHAARTPQAQRKQKFFAPLFFKKAATFF